MQAHIRELRVRMPGLCVSVRIPTVASDLDHLMVVPMGITEMG